MHILMTANSAWNIWNFRSPVVKALSRDGHRITVLTPADHTSTELERLGCRFRPLKMSVESLVPFQDIKLQHRLKRIFREEQPDLVLSYTIKNNIYGARAAQNLGIPFVPNVTGLGTAFLSGKVLQTVVEQLYRRSFRIVPTVFFQNVDDRDLFLRRSLVRTEQARLLPGSGIDLIRFRPAAMPPVKAPPVFLMVARIVKDKGVLEFIEAAKKIKSRHPNARFQLLGAAAPKNRSAIDTVTLNSWIAEGVVEYLGTTDDVRPAIEAATCVVLPSYREGAPRALIEAAAMARPVITTDVPGCRAVIDHEISGFLCKARSASSLANSIELFLAMPYEAQKKMGHAGRIKMVREYDQSHVVDAYRDVVARSIKTY